MARKLKNLRITEISSCDVGANPGARVMLMKRVDPNAATLSAAHRPKKKPRNLFQHQEAARAQARARRKKMASKLYRKMLKAFNKASKPPPAPPPLDVATEIAKGVAAGETWEQSATRAYRKSMALPGNGGPEYFENVHPETRDYTDVRDVSAAYEAAMAKARKMAERNNITVEAAFARIWEDPANHQMTRDDHQHHLAKTTRAALGLPPSTGPALRPDQRPDYRKPVVGDELTKQVRKLMKGGASFEAAATAALRAA